MPSKFEQLLDFLVNEETDKANELFHEIVVEKSREIYENLIAEEEEESVEEMTDDEDDSVDEEAEDEDDSVDEGFGMDEAEDEFPVQDQTDDFASDIEDPDAMGDEDDLSGGDEFGDDEGGDEPATKDDVLDLKSALEELQSEFEALMSAERNEEDNEPGVHDDEEGNDPLDSVDDEGDSEEDDSEEDDSSEEDEAFPMKESRTGKKSQGETMREYIEKVSVSMVDGEGVGSGRGDKAGQTGGVIKHSPISSGKGKPETGANAKNIAQKGMGENQDGQTPTKPKSSGVMKTGGEFVKAGTKNVASSANSKKPDGAKLTSVGKPGNKEGAGVGAVAGGDKAGQTGGVQTRSPLSGAPHRNA